MPSSAAPSFTASSITSPVVPGWFEVAVTLMPLYFFTIARLAP